MNIPVSSTGWISKKKGEVVPGMTLCVESFIGSEGGREGVKLEEQVIITETGVERMSTYPYQIDWL